MSIEEKDKIKELLSAVNDLETLSEPRRELIRFLKQIRGDADEGGDKDAE